MKMSTNNDYNPSNYKRVNLLKFDASVFSLLIVNLITIFFAVTQGWNLFTIVLVYWFQNIIIGLFNFIRILSLKEFSTENFKINNKPAQPTTGTKISTAFFFALHYGFFHFIYLIVILFGDIFAPAKSSITFNNQYFLFLFISIAIFFVNHLFSFIYNKKNDEVKKQNIGILMLKPYARIIPTHLILILGGFIVNSSHYILLFLLLKTLVDIMMHNSEHG